MKETVESVDSDLREAKSRLEKVVQSKNAGAEMRKPGINQVASSTGGSKRGSGNTNPWAGDDEEDEQEQEEEEEKRTQAYDPDSQERLHQVK